MKNWNKRLNFLRKYLCCEIPFALLRRKDVFFPHAIGIVIGQHAKIGKQVVIYSNVTIGGKVAGTPDDYPTIEDDVTIYTGACIIGKITIGKGSVIGANVTVTKDVLPNSIIVNDMKIRDLRERN